MKASPSGLPFWLQPIALATSTIHYYVCVILLPVLVLAKYSSLTGFELGVMFTGQTCGTMLTYKFIEPAVRTFGLNKVINLGFFILVAANFMLYISVLLIVNSSDFSTAVFLTRFVSGIGCGLIDSSCLISRTHYKTGFKTP